MFQWDAVDTSPNLDSQNVIKTFEMAIRHDRRTIRTELERVFCRWMYFYLRSKIVFWLSYRGGGAIARVAFHLDPPLMTAAANHKMRASRLVASCP